MSAQMDVLARAVERLRAPHPDHAQDAANNAAAMALHEYRAAVAELIEECERLCKAADGMKRSADGMSRRSPVAITLRTAAANILSLRPLLANVGGAK